MGLFDTLFDIACAAAVVGVAGYAFSNDNMRESMIDTAERNREDFYKEAEKRGASSERIAEHRARSAQSFDNARRISNNITEYKAKRASRMEEDY